MGRADSELLNQSIEAAMPKRVEINEEFLADMIEQAQPKPSPSKRRDGDAGRNFSRASTAKVRSGASSTKTTSAVADDDDFLLQSIASVLPQSSSSRRTRSSGLGTPPKKARAMTGEAAGTSNGPKRVPPRAVLPNAHNPPSPHSCSVIRTKDSLRPAGISLKKSSKCAINNNSSSSALFNAALQSSALVESQKTSEKVRDASSLMQQQHQPNEESDTLSEDNYSPLTDNAMVVDKNVPRDVDEEFQAEQLIIDCSVVSDTVKQTAVRPVQKLSGIRPSAAQRLGKSTKNFSRRSSEQEIGELPAPWSSNESSPGSPQTSTPKSSSLTSRARYAGKTPKNPGFMPSFVREKVRDVSQSRNSDHLAMKFDQPTKSMQKSTKVLSRREVVQNKSARVQPFSCRNAEEKETTKTLPIPDAESDKKTAAAAATEDSENDKSTACEKPPNASSVKKKQPVKQMLITTV
ncbi:unnamed protein product [Gongylonema pulchrum]|uniref:Shugoshin_C domain-containing protein n=1 Tax=Gongylonema pulchrum TaxID=637853 RepID=A0A183DXH4_9BILA|nr:unnamed protein product [Gongylonema pulchrum]